MSGAPGQVLHDRYRLVERFAAGGMGDVWRADDTVLGRTVAVKILRPEHASDPDFLERFRAEARHAAALSHPNIAAVHDYGELVDGGVTLAYLVMELVPGEPLSTLIARAGPLSVARTLDLLAPAADALHAAHQSGVIHRDVKPGNILVRPDDSATFDSTVGGVALTDFGIARATNDPGHLTRSGLVLGTAYYLSPEQAQGKPVTPASDVYALGVVAYECLSGKRPFSGDNAVHVAVAHMRDDPPPLPAAVPDGVRTLVMSMLAKDPADRPGDAATVAAAARALRDHLSEAPGATGPLADDAATKPFAPASAATVVAGAGGVAAGAGGVAAAAETPPPAREGRPRWASAAYADQKRTRTILLLVGLTVVVIGAALLALLSGDPKTSTPVATASPTPQATSPAPRPPTVRVDEAAYVGRPYDKVEKDLKALGLAVQRKDVSSDAERDTVLSVDPHGDVRAHATVTVTVAKPAKGKHGKGEGGND